MKRLYVSLSFHYLVSSPNQTKGSNGFFNQIQSLLNAIQIAERLGRELVVDGFFPDYERNETVLLSKIIDVGSLPHSIRDGFSSDRPKKSRFLRDFCNPSVGSWLQRIQRFEQQEPDLFVGCCFYYSLDGQRLQEDLNRLRFHPFFYDIIRDFLVSHPSFHAVHYRTEEDFLMHFYDRTGFESTSQMRVETEKWIGKHLEVWSGQPVLFMTADPVLPRLPLKILRFRISQEEETAINTHLGICWPRIREVRALLDFLLCESPSCKDFLGVYQSSFSRGLEKRRAGRRNQLLDINRKLILNR